VRGILLLVIALMFFNWLVPQPPGWVTAAQSKPMLDSIGEKLMAALPEDAEATILKKLKGGSSDAAAPAEGTGTPSEAAPEDDNPADDSSYGQGTRQGLDQLIENSGGGD
jgi:membrane protein required for colicin V production